MPLPRPLQRGIPHPHLPDRPQWIAAYERAWELAWEARENSSQNAWDVCMATFWQRYAAAEVQDEISLLHRLQRFYSSQEESGAIPLNESSERWHAGFPPPFAFAEWELYQLNSSEERMANVFPVIAAHFDYLAGHHAREQGYFHHGKSYGSVASTALAALEAAYIARAGLICDKFAISESSSSNFLGFKELVNEKMWDEFHRHYCDVDEDELWAGKLDIGSFWPLLAGIATPEYAHEMMRHLRTYRSFARHFMVPCAAAYERGFSPAGAPHKGAVSPAQTYLVLRALEQHEEYALAQHIAANHLECMAKVFDETGNFWNHYAPDSAAPGEKSEKDMLGDAGIAAVAMLIEYIFGIHVYAPLSEVEWTVQWPEPHGISNLRVGNAVVDMQAKPLEGNRFEISLNTTAPVDFKIKAYASSYSLISSLQGHRTIVVE